ncbi:MAG: DUF4013 domain-containing protein [Methanomicrobium sp.]|uniref:DUF4013 domain-containing protein n=1 Tax=Methanomicrobium mobile TaxID=2205 RepID=UPI0005B2A7FE|nr:DUF4013 domain-containing protein [Methanomicrobium mobile]MBP5083166.1 DUF4013 domain-containing protein [Methanomicrobium sp.]
MSHDIIGKAFTYTKDGFLGEWKRWILLLILVFIQAITFYLVPVFNGYLLRVAGSNDSAPDVNQWVKLFIDGWKVLIVELIYMLPVIILAVVFGFLALVPELMVIASGGTPNVQILLGMVLSLAIIFLVSIIITLFLFMGIIRLGQTGKLGEAFNFGAINKAISSGVGWLGYIGYCILLWIIIVIYGIVIGLLNVIPIVGLILALIITPLVAVFSTSCIRNIYTAGNQ